MKESTNQTYAKIPAEIKPIRELKDTRKSSVPKVRLEDTRAAAHRLRDKLSSGPQAAYYRTFDLIRAPYPTKYGLLNAFSLPTTPFMHILNRLFVVQYQSSAGLKTLLFSPSDLDGNAETPFFKRLANSFGPFRDLGKRLIAPTLATVEDCLAQLNLKPEQIDYISYDHLHTQELRKWLGTHDQPAFFPNAKLLVMRQEWDSASGLLPPQADWYCPDGTAGVDRKKIVLLDNDTMLGDGVALIRSPGHTEGNHSLAVNTPEAVLVSSENGVSADSYAPLHSRVPGVRKYALHTGMEVILNGNTLESGLDQYISMVLEKELAGPSPRNPNFYNVVPSSEMTWYWAFPGIKPTFSFGPLEYGELQLDAKSRKSKKNQRVDRRPAA